MYLEVKKLESVLLELFIRTLTFTCLTILWVL